MPLYGDLSGNDKGTLNGEQIFLRGRKRLRLAPSPTLTNSPNVWNGEGWAWQNVGAGNAVQVSQVDDRDRTQLL